mmetsp:Transcript_13657/g.29301  ORF Transcript_13657/g.29301 Transcript_13657/m.29301 type:complete len:285 (+) Transcript_13657:15-869(+)
MQSQLSTSAKLQRRLPACQNRQVLRVHCNSASPADAKSVPVPSNAAQQTAQAAAAIESAWRAGSRMQRVELLLPLIGATDLDDWPGGIRQQFKAAQPLVENILRAVKQLEGLQGPLGAEIWDQGDAVGAWKGAKLAAVLFPTADSIKKLRELASGPSAPELLLIINPQWETKGLMLGQSDFGIGQRRVDNEKFVGSFAPSYYLKQLRVYGDNVRVLKAHPGDWQVYVLDRKGGADLIGTFPDQPQYADVEELLRQRPDSMMNKGLMERLELEWKFNQDSLKGPM